MTLGELADRLAALERVKDTIYRLDRTIDPSDSSPTTEYKRTMLAAQRLRLEQLRAEVVQL